MPTPVYIVAGQSNAYSLNGGNGGSSVAGTFAELTGSNQVQVTSVSAAGAPLTWGRDGLDWFSNGELFDQLVATILTQLSEPGSYLAGVMWIQGEGDSWSFARATEYAARLTELVHRLEEALASRADQIADFRFSVLALSADCPAGASHANWQTIRQQQLSLDDPRIDVIDVDQVAAAAHQDVATLYQSDGLHYAAGANDLVLGALMDRTPLQLDGTMGNDRLRGLAGDDTMRGGGGNDALSGNGGDDALRSWTGSDTLYGGSGADTLTGDGGADWLYGGTGADRFVFTCTADSGTTAASRDIVGDFSHGSDRIDLSPIDANSQASGYQAFAFIGTAAFSHQAGEARFTRSAEGVTLMLDVNGDGLADASLLLAHATWLTATDLIL